MTRTPTGVLRVEIGLAVAQEAGLQDVAATAIGKKTALVQVHLLTGGLEVESHCTPMVGSNKGQIICFCTEVKCSPISVLR